MVKDNVAVRHAVKLGIKDNGLVEVTGDDLREGMLIATTGAYGLANNTRVRVTNQ